MAQAMEDDDMIVVIIGEEAVTNARKRKSSPYPVSVKQEPVHVVAEPDVDVILDRLTKHGEYIEIKQEKEEYDVEYLDTESPFKTEDDSDLENKVHIPKVFNEVNKNNCGMKKSSMTKKQSSKNMKQRSMNMKQSSKNMKQNRKNMKQNKMNMEQKRTEIPDIVIKTKDKRSKFLIEQLRKQFPRFREDSSVLVEHLAKIMQKWKPPLPPPDHCKQIIKDGVITYECNTCFSKTDTPGAADRHYQIKHGERYLMCFACGLTYTCTINLYKHEKRCRHKYANIVLRARGQYLGRKGKGRPFTTDHKFAPHDDKPPKIRPRLYCTQCPASFHHKYNLEAHENSHAGLRPYKCDTCPAAYTSEVALRRHLQTHGDDQFTCDDCGRVFKLKTLLISHINTHRPLRKYPCAYCPRRFAQKTALRHHQNKVHLNLPPEHACPVCPKRYARMSHVRDHMKRVHGLSMITRKMFFKTLPILADVDLVKPAKIVFSETEPSPLMYVDVDQTVSEKTNKTELKMSTHKTVLDNEIQHLWTNAKAKDEEEKGVHTIVVDEEEKGVHKIVMDEEQNAGMMKELMEYMQLRGPEVTVRTTK